MATDTQVATDEPDDLEVSADIAKVLGVSQRTMIRWSSAEVSDPIPRYLRTVHNIERACLSWADVRDYCERNRKHKELARLKQHLGIAQTPDPVLSDRLSASVAATTAQTVSMPLSQPVTVPMAVPMVTSAKMATPLSQSLALPSEQSLAATMAVRDALLEELREELRELRAGRDELVKQVSELAASLAESRQGEAVLRETVNQLQKRLNSNKERLAAEITRSRERLEAEVERRLEERTRLDAQLNDLQISHDQEVKRLVEQLGVRQQEAAEMRQAAERQQQREALLRMQAATATQQRDVLAGVLGELEGAGLWRRLTWSPPPLEIATSSAGGGVVDVGEGDVEP